MPINLILKLVIQLIMSLGPEWLKRLPWDQISRLIGDLIGRINEAEKMQTAGQAAAIDWNQIILLVIQIIQMIMQSQPPVVATHAPAPPSPSSTDSLRDQSNQLASEYRPVVTSGPVSE